ncbi:MAG: peptidase M48 [Bacteroidetes bacterium RIFCSPHIGHO2_02_FULL_44_7]|nr:MAG: peptidase M48 [Bacteroidetes bacterium RIFCSPHIGHO2_02_FULL_44_7]
MKKRTGFAFVCIVALLSACGLINEKNKGKGVNLFTVQQDKDLGAQVAAEIDGNPREYPILDSAQYKEVYTYLYRVRDKILNSGRVDFKDDFKWRLRVIHDDSTLNAFCTPGGYIYIYTGILKFLDSEDQLAGVLGHEIAHADMRHSTRQMTTMFGVQLMLDVLAGDRAALKQVTGALVGLKFSRNHETQADEKSVYYLCPTDYKADGGAGFFEKIQAMGGSRVPAFLSTHPDPGDRVEHFHNTAITSGCQGTKDYKVNYQRMISKLPK